MEQALIEQEANVQGARLICLSAGRAQAARRLAADPARHVTLYVLDAWHAHAVLSDGAADSPLEVVCAADLPDQLYDACLFPISFRGEAELTRDLLQQAYERLVLGGQIWAAVDNPQDRWVRQELEKIASRVRRVLEGPVVCYVADKREPLKKHKSFECEFAFRDESRLLWAYSRPGVFAHRRVDVGARRILEAMRIEPGMRVLEIGCGSGVASLAAAARFEDVRVHAVDSHARAVQCVARGAERNGLAERITTELNALGQYAEPGSFDLVLANPPYYGQFDIARRFLDAAVEALRPGGQLLLVTKLAPWYAEHLCEWFDEPSLEEVKGYFLARGVKRR